jgi:flagellar biogenesis protein FliO
VIEVKSRVRVETRRVVVVVDGSDGVILVVMIQIVIALRVVHHHPITVEIGHDGVRNHPKSRHHDDVGVEVVVVSLLMRKTPMIKTVGADLVRVGRSRRHPPKSHHLVRTRGGVEVAERARVVAVEEVTTALTVVEVVVTVILKTREMPVGERPRRGPLRARRHQHPIPSHHHHGIVVSPRFKSTMHVMPIRECVHSIPISDYGGSHVWVGGRMYYDNVPSVLRRLRRSMIIMPAVGVII